MVRLRLAPAYYAMAAALVGVIAVACMKESASKPLVGSPPSVKTAEEVAELVHTQSLNPGFRPTLCTEGLYRHKAVRALPHLIAFRT